MATETNNQMYSFIDAARYLSVDPFELVNLTSERDIPYSSDDEGLVTFSQKTLDDYINGVPFEVASEVIEESKDNGEEVPYVETIVDDTTEPSSMDEVETNFLESIDAAFPEETYVPIEDDEPITGSGKPQHTFISEDESRTLMEDGKACALYLINQILEKENLGSDEIITSVHSTFSRFNKRFAKMFPYLDPVSLTDLMANEGLIDIERRVGGVRMSINYDNDKVPDLLQREPSDLVLSKLEKEVTRYDYSTKKEWRQKWFDLIESNIEIDEDTTVLMLGGFGDEIVGYQKLGIPIENIVAVECDWLRSGFLKKTFPGIQVYKGFLSNYLSNTDLGFDAVLLDYDGQLTDKNINILPLVTPLLKHKAVFGINVLGNREGNGKSTYSSTFVKPKLNGWLDNRGLPREEYNEDNQLGVLRDKGITAAILRSLSNSITSGTMFSELYGALPKNRKPTNKQKKEILKQGPAKQFKHRLDMIDNLADHLKSKNISPYFALLRGIFSTDPLIPDSIERHHYEAVGNYNYFSDFVVVQQFKGDIEDLIDTYIPSKYKKYIYGSMNTANLERSYNSLSSRDKHSLNSKVKQVGEELLKEYCGLFLPESLPARERIAFDKSKVTSEIKLDVIEMIKSGKSNEYILEQHPEVRRSLGALKAAHTRGAYNK